MTAARRRRRGRPRRGSARRPRARRRGAGGGRRRGGRRGVRAVAQPIQRLRGRVERAHRPAQVTGGESDLRLGHLAARLGEALAWAEGARGAPKELARAIVVAELGHGDAAQGEGRRVVAQRDALESAEGIAGRQRARGGGDDGVHLRRIHVAPVRRSTTARGRRDPAAVRAIAGAPASRTRLRAAAERYLASERGAGPPGPASLRATLAASPLPPASNGGTSHRTSPSCSSPTRT